MAMAYRRSLCFLLFLALFAPAFSDLIITKADRRIDLSSHIIRVSSTIKVENKGTTNALEFLLAIPDFQGKHLAYLSVSSNEGKGRLKGPIISLPVVNVQLEAMPPNLTFYSVAFPNELKQGELFTLEVLSVFTHLLKPFPEEISQADDQLVLFQDSALYLSPYEVLAQSLTLKLPSQRVESYTKLQNSKLVDSEIRYGPYENVKSFSYNPIVVHYENNQPFAVARELLREIEVSHWGSVKVVEHYTLVHGGARTKGGFSRFEYQSRYAMSGSSSFRRLVARLPPRAHSIYYRDEIGNISTSNLRMDLRKTELEVEPRFPIFGGWKTSFTIGYSLPLQNFLFESEGKRFLNFSFGCPFDEVVIDNLTVKVALPEGSREISVSIPFSTKEWRETKYSHLDITGRPVVVLQKDNIVPEHNQPFQVYYIFNSLSLLHEPLMLIVGIFALFLACIIYMHSDLSISKSNASYLARLQYEETRSTIQQVLSTIRLCLNVHDKLEASLHDLFRTGDVHKCKSVRKAADSLLKEYGKELKMFQSSLESCSQESKLIVNELVSKEREAQEKLMTKQLIVIDCYEKKMTAADIEGRVRQHQQKYLALRQEVDDLVDRLDEI